MLQQAKPLKYKKNSDEPRPLPNRWAVQKKKWYKTAPYKIKEILDQMSTQLIQPDNCLTLESLERLAIFDQCEA